MTNPKISNYDPEQGACRADLAPKVFKDQHRVNTDIILNFHLKNTGERD
jgi:hypothetical protein